MGDDELTAEQIAQICHDANRAYALATGEDPATVWPSWENASEEIKASAITGVSHAMRGATPEDLHASWMESKAAAGWVFGDVRDNDAKRHPCMVPYNKLPKAQQVKDHLFSGIVASLVRF